MPSIGDALEDALSSVERLRSLLSKSKSKQVSAGEERAVIKATALAWFKNCRPLLAQFPNSDLLREADSTYQVIFEAAARATLRMRYNQDLKSLKAILVRVRSEALLLTTSGALVDHGAPTPPNFVRLIPDPAMQAILARRWAEAWNCLEAKAFLAATVMMGALLEALLLARINRLTDKSPVFTSKCAPKDRSGKTRPLQEWTLNAYIDVSHDLGWIGKASRDIGVVLRDYRNFIHPEKELSQGISVGEADCRMFGAVLSALADQIIKS